MVMKTMESPENADVFELKPNPHKLAAENESVEHRNPFEFMQIDNTEFLNTIDGRSACPKCSKSRKFFCYTCYVPVENVKARLPTVRLPVQIDIIKHQKETDGKSTAIHAAILAPENVNIYTFPDIPDYSTLENDETVSERIFFFLSKFSIKI